MRRKIPSNRHGKLSTLDSRLTMNWQQAAAGTTEQITIFLLKSLLDHIFSYFCRCSISLPFTEGKHLSFGVRTRSDVQPWLSKEDR
jgi:hypothetical protein